MLSSIVKGGWRTGTDQASTSSNYRLQVETATESPEPTAFK